MSFNTTLDATVGAAEQAAEFATNSLSNDTAFIAAELATIYSTD